MEGNASLDASISEAFSVPELAQVIQRCEAIGYKSVKAWADKRVITQAVAPVEFSTDAGDLRHIIDAEVESAP